MSRRPSTAKSPTKTSPVKGGRRAAEVIESREHLTYQEVTVSHDKTCEYLIGQHREVVEDLRRDNKLLREENALLR